MRWAMLKWTMMRCVSCHQCESHVQEMSERWKRNARRLLPGEQRRAEEWGSSLRAGYESKVSGVVSTCRERAEPQPLGASTNELAGTTKASFFQSPNTRIQPTPKRSDGFTEQNIIVASRRWQTHESNNSSDSRWIVSRNSLHRTSHLPKLDEGVPVF